MYSHVASLDVASETSCTRIVRRFRRRLFPSWAIGAVRQAARHMHARFARRSAYPGLAAPVAGLRQRKLTDEDMVTETDSLEREGLLARSSRDVEVGPHKI